MQCHVSKQCVHLLRLACDLPSIWLRRSALLLHSRIFLDVSLLISHALYLSEMLTCTPLGLWWWVLYEPWCTTLGIMWGRDQSACRFELALQLSFTRRYGICWKLAWSSLLYLVQSCMSMLILTKCACVAARHGFTQKSCYSNISRSGLHISS